jgi:hypothetical protein
VGKPEGKRPLGRPRHKWEDNITMELREIAWRSIECIQIAQDRGRWQSLVNKVMNLSRPGAMELVGSFTLCP